MNDVMILKRFQERLVEIGDMGLHHPDAEAMMLKAREEGIKAMALNDVSRDDALDLMKVILQDYIKEWSPFKMSSANATRVQNGLHPLAEDFQIVSIMYGGIAVWNPYLSECGRFENEPSHYGFQKRTIDGIDHWMMKHTGRALVYSQRNVQGIDVYLCQFFDISGKTTVLTDYLWEVSDSASIRPVGDLRGGLLL